MAPSDVRATPAEPTGRPLGAGLWPVRLWALLVGTCSGTGRGLSAGVSIHGWRGHGSRRSCRRGGAFPRCPTLGPKGRTVLLRGRACRGLMVGSGGPAQPCVPGQTREGNED